MFTGLVSAIGELAAIDNHRHTIRCPDNWLDGVAVGDSIAVDGICLTAVSIDADTFAVDVSDETRSRAVPFVAGQPLNLEKSLVVGDAIGGHFVTGHIDGCAKIISSDECADGGRDLRLSLADTLQRFVAEKGSVALAGVSLTVNRVGDDGCFDVHLIPHTLAQTCLDRYAAGDLLNVEVDLLARYICRAARR